MTTIAILFESFRVDTLEEERPHIALVSMYAPHYYQNVLKDGYDVFVRLSSYIRFTPEERILAKAQIGILLKLVEVI